MTGTTNDRQDHHRCDHADKDRTPRSKKDSKTNQTRKVEAGGAMALYEPQFFFDPGQSWTENDNVPYAVNNNGISGTYGENGDAK